ncbi:MAG TPA: hypothetical protein DFS52_02760 [Myxococcales bacterium]|jgi:uncharacterized protein (TIGR03382 family)|nr:hypothetical protein [Myxococcales bacterium]
MSWKAVACLLAVALSGAPARAEKCPNMMILLDRSGSMDGYKWQTAVEAINGFTSGREAVMRFGLFLFPSPSDGNCGSGLWKVRCDFYNAEAIADALEHTRPGGMTPTADALAAASRTSDMTDASRRRFIILLTDGDPTCPDENAIDDNVDLAVRNLDSLLADGIKTFVIGFGQSASPARLNRLAAAGGAARVGTRCTDPYNPGATVPCQYYEANDKASLSAAFDAIATIAQGELQGNSCDDSCYSNRCPEGMKCVQDLHFYLAGSHTLNLGKCVDDPCARTVCEAEQFCREGACVNACLKPCPSGTICEDGACVADPCSKGGCSGCATACAKYLVCLDGRCVDDPCRHLSCPPRAGYCYRGSCYASTEDPDPGTSEDPLAPPKRGCTCGGSSSAALAALVLGVLLVRRRRCG